MRRFSHLEALLLGFCLSLSGPALATEVRVDGDHDGKDATEVAGLPTFRTLGAALAAAPDDGSPWTVHIAAGRYREKLSVDRPEVRFLGAGEDRTVITFDAHADTPGADGMPLGTHGSWTLRVTAPGFQARSLTIENAFDYPGNRARPEDDPTRVTNMQGVALMLDAGSDRALFEDVTLDGYQDTLFVDAGRSLFRDCRVIGHVDFIFGAGQAVFERCDIESRNRVDKNPTGYVTAPSTLRSYPFGFLFVQSRFLRHSPDVPAGSVRLGRPWHPGGNPEVNGSAVFLDCFMDDHVGPEGYAPISAAGPDPDGERVWYEVGPDSRFFEHGSFGPGALDDPRRPRLEPAAAAWYTPEAVLNGWHPDG